MRLALAGACWIGCAVGLAHGADSLPAPRARLQGDRVQPAVERGEVMTAWGWVAEDLDDDTRPDARPGTAAVDETLQADAGLQGEFAAASGPAAHQAEQAESARHDAAMQLQPTPADAPSPASTPAATSPAPLFESPLTSDAWGDVFHPGRPQAGPRPMRYLIAHPPDHVAAEYDDVFEADLAHPDQVLDYTSGQNPIDLYRPDGLAPIGILGGQTLNVGGEFLLTYRYQTTSFSGLRDGTHDVSDASVLSVFPIAPTRMTRSQHSVTGEFAVSDRLTFLGQLPFVQTQMDFVTAAGQSLHQSSTDIGDLTFMALYAFARTERQQLHFNMGFSVPSGLYRPLTYAPAPGDPSFTYPLRVGSGTWDFLPGLTYRGQNDCWTWGAQALGTVRFGRNNLGNRLGDQVDLTAWASRQITQRIAGSFRLDYQILTKIHAADPNLDAMLTPTNRPDLYAGQRLNALFGAYYYLPAERFPLTQRLSVEGGIPMYQWLSGPQLKQTWTLTAGWQFLF